MRNLVLILTIVTAAALTGCESYDLTAPETSPESGGAMLFRLSLGPAAVLDLDVAKVTADLTHIPLGEETSTDFTIWPDSTWAEATVGNLRVGSWQVVVSVYDSGDTLLASGSDTAIVTVGQITPVVIALQVSGGIHITVTWGDSLGQATWSQVQTSGPLPASRAAHNAIYDPQGHRMIVHGGWSSVPYNSLNDTWAFDLETNTWAQITTTGSSPLNRAGHVAVYDSNRHRMIIFAGGNWWQAWYGDVWALDLATNAWSQLQTIGAGPSARLWPSGVYRPQTDELIIFGGWCGSVSSNWNGNDVWALNLATSEWRQVIAGGDVPGSRQQSSMILDEGHNRLIVFGGVDSSGYLRDAWALDLGTNQWTSLPDFQNTVCQHQAVYVAERNLMVAVGGWGTYNHDQVIALSTVGDQWLDLEVTGDLPRQRQNLSAIWDPVGHRLIMFGGDIGSLNDDLNDTWQLTFSN